VALTADDFDGAPVRLGQVELPVPFTPNRRPFLTEILRRLRATDLAPAAGRAGEDGGSPSAAARRASHPVAACPDAERHVRALRRANRLDREITALSARRVEADATLAGQFERVLALLEQRGALEGWALTGSGEVLRRVYHECDLLVTEAVVGGLFDDLDPPALAGLAAALVYEHRSPGEPPEAWIPPGPLRDRLERLADMARDLNAAEAALRLPLTRPPDVGFTALAHGWAAGEDLGDVLADELVSGGDFVRNVKQLIDLLGQLAEIAPVPATARAARRAADAVFRGVVAASSAVAPVGEEGHAP